MALPAAVKRFLEEAGCRVLREARVVALPFSSRSPEGFRRLLSKKGLAECGGARRVFMVFYARGLAEKYYVCLASGAGLSFTVEEAFDVLSGMRQPLRRPALVLDGCRISAEWRGSMYVVGEGAVASCPLCRVASHG